MEIRKTLEQNQKAAAIATAVVLVLALISIAWQMKGPPKPGAPTKAFYTVDDGATYFVDTTMRVPPFDYNGKEAVGAKVIEGDNGKRFVAYLIRFSKAKKARLDAALAKNPDDPDTKFEVLNGADEVKKIKSPAAPWAAVGSGAGIAATQLDIPPDVKQPLAPADP